MRTTRSTTILIGVALAIVVSAATLAEGMGPGNGRGGNRGERLQAYLATLPVEQLSQSEKKGLLAAREEEKLAYDVYTTLGAKWNVRIFENVARAEQTHADAVKLMLDRYHVSDPTEGLAVGAFRDEKLQKLYTDLVAKGNLSLKDALEVGATIEELDLRDVAALVAESDNQDLDTVYQNLAKGSRNHLRGFVDNLRMQSSTYSPRYLDQTTFDAVVASERERGIVYDAAGNPAAGIAGGRCNGMGRGHAKGAGNGRRGSGNRPCDGSGPGNGSNGNQGSGKG